MRDDGKDDTAGANGRATRARAVSYEPLTLEGHVHLAPVLYAARLAVNAAFPGFPKSGSPTRELLRFLRAIDALRAALDRQVCTLVPANRDPRRLAIRIYYGAQLTPRLVEGREADAFAAWAEVEEEGANGGH